MKKLSNKEKGTIAEKEFENVLKSRGYVVFRIPKTRWNNCGDIFGLFDLIGVNKDGFVGVQVKCNNTRGMIKRLKMWKAHPYNFLKVLAVKYDSGVWREININKIK